jgi:hypothetical protein
MEVYAGPSAKMYRDGGRDFPLGNQGLAYMEGDEVLLSPSIPKYFDRLYNDWAALNFSKTRGVLRLMARYSSSLDQSGCGLSLCQLPYPTPDNNTIRVELTRYLPERLELGHRKRRGWSTFHAICR